MGLLRLFVHDDQRLAGIDPARVFMVGFDELPWLAHVYVSDNQLVIERAESDSGSVCVPFETPDRGELLLATTTLMEREAPYFLEVELARGVVNRLRNQLAAWRQLGLVVDEELENQAEAATAAFVRSASRQNDPAEAAEAADKAIRLGVAAAERLVTTYAEQALGLRLRQSGKLNTLLGVDLGEKLPDDSQRQPIAHTFNLVAVPMAWRTVEASEGHRDWADADQQLQWARKNDLKVVGGPLLDFDAQRVPDWTYLWEGDFDTLASFMLDHVTNAVNRYRGKVNLWHVAARMNRAGVLALSDEDRLQIVATAVRTVRNLDPRTPVLVSFDQPWAEYMATQQVELAPIHFADALVRADLGIAGIGLELNIGAGPGATTPRMPMDFSRLIDGWGLFELPLFVVLSADTNKPEREEWIEHHLPALLAKNSVQVVLWNQLSDEKSDFPGAGLFNDAGQPKPALTALAQLRQQYLT